jgi:alkanesulfonate monooxygenase
MSNAAPKGLEIRTKNPAVEVAWFAALCSDDYEFLGVPDGKLRSSFNHCGSLVKRADELGYQNILLPSSWQVGQEPIPFAAAAGIQTSQINQLLAVRMTEIHPPMLARHLSTLDHLLKGRLTVNIISSDLPGERLDSASRYQRSREALEILKQCWTKEEIHYRGDFYNIDLDRTDPAKPYQHNGGPLLYFGGISSDAVQLCAEHCDVFLMWPETEDELSQSMHRVGALARESGRTLDYGLRIHVIVRETEAQARDAAQHLMSRLDPEVGEAIKARAQDNQSSGVQRQDALRSQSNDDYIEDLVWSGIGRARSGCASAIVGNPDQVYAKLMRYVDLGIRSFVLSGYPHHEECELFAKFVLPRLNTCKLNETQGRNIPNPETPLTTLPRK